MAQHPFDDERALSLAWQEEWRDEAEDNTSKRTLEESFKDAVLMFSAIIEHAKAGLIKAVSSVEQPFKQVVDAYFSHSAIMGTVKGQAMMAAIEKMISRVSGKESSRAVAALRAT